MLLWLVIAVLLAATLAAILLPLHWGRDELETREAYDANIFKDQLKTIDRDLEEGLIDEDDAEAARVEISRKLLAAAEQADATPLIKAADGRYGKPVIAGFGVIIAAASLGLYFAVGNPGLQDLPLHARAKPEPKTHKGQDLNALIASAEAQLQKNPSDAHGWAIMAPIYMRHGKYNKAVAAYQNVLRLSGPSGQRYAGLLDAMVFANNGIVPAEALGPINLAIKSYKDQPKPHFWLALYNEQNNKLDDAVKGYTSLLKQSAEDVPWRKMVQGRLNEVLKKQGKPAMTVAGIKVQSQPPQIKLGDALKADQGAAEKLNGPTREDVQRAQSMSPEDRKLMIENMIEGLGERLKDEGGNVASWMRLVNAYNVMGRKSEARDAIKMAKQNLKNDKQALGQLDQLARRLGLGS